MTDFRYQNLWIVGPGRLGLALGSRLLGRGAARTVTFVGKASSAPVHPVFADGAVYANRSDAGIPTASIVLITVPDASIQEVALWLATLGHPRVPVLHTSGVLSSEALDRLAALGWQVGSLHPLVAIPDPIASAGKLDGAWFGLEGTPPAIEAGKSIVTALDGHVLMVDPAGKPLYHAAAVFASNYLVTLLYAAEKLMAEAGVARRDAACALAGLAEGALRDVFALGAETALTGPIARGDVETVAIHLRGLSPEDRPLYSELARTAVEIARRRGLSADAVQRLLNTVEGGAP